MHLRTTRESEGAFGDDISRQVVDADGVFTEAFVDRYVRVHQTHLCKIFQSFF